MTNEKHNKKNLSDAKMCVCAKKKLHKGKILKYRQSDSSDLIKILELLETYELPSSDCKDHINNFVVAYDNRKIVGVGGFENCGSLGLLRSFAVRPSDKNQGIAEQIFNLVKAKALGSGINQFYLLTTTASQYFKRLGFTTCNRDDVPNAIKATKQFDGLCPSSAVVMVLDL